MKRDKIEASKPAPASPSLASDVRGLVSHAPAQVQHARSFSSEPTTPASTRSSRAAVTTATRRGGASPRGAATSSGSTARAADNRARSAGNALFTPAPISTPPQLFRADFGAAA